LRDEGMLAQQQLDTTQATLQAAIVLIAADQGIRTAGIARSCPWHRHRHSPTGVHACFCMAPVIN